MKKFLSAVIALILMAVVIWVAFGSKIMDKYSYSKELADLDAYYGIENPSINGEDGNLVIILQDERIEDRAIVKDGYIYFAMDTVASLFNEGFYVDGNEQIVLYTMPEDTLVIPFGEKHYSDSESDTQTPYTICFMHGDTLYMAADFVRNFANFSYERYDRYMQVYTEWDVKQVYEISKNTQLRTKGGIKSPILCELAKDDVVEILEQMETWSKVKTRDSVIGYVENKRLANLSTEIEEPVTDWTPEEYSAIAMDEKVCLGWHAIGGVGGNDTLNAMIQEGKGMNVIAPTWFSLTDSEGNYRSFATPQYVTKAHEKGLQVWGVWDNFNYKNESGEEVSSYQVLSSTTKRQALVAKMIEETLNLEMDGINIDYEGLTPDSGPHFVQFIRELSVGCRKNNIVLSIDNYVPLNSNDYYRLDIQGKVADYVIIMGYDEHWHGSGNPGSVASIDFVTGGIERTIAKMPSEKVVNGLPFYTIEWKIKGLEVSDDYITLVNQADLIARVGAKAEWDEITCQNYAEWKEGETTYKIWLEDTDSLRVKLNVMNAHQIGGVAVWRLGYGTSEAWDLVAAYAGMK